MNSNEHAVSIGLFVTLWLFGDVPVWAYSHFV